MAAGTTPVVAVVALSARRRSSSVAVTDAVLVMVPAAVGALTVIVMAGAVPTSRPGRVQVTVPPVRLKFQPVPEALIKVTPAGSVSMTVTALAGLGPLLLTWRV